MVKHNLDAEIYEEPHRQKCVKWFYTHIHVYSHLIYRDYSVDEGALKIDRLRPEDAGTYICNAQNDMGKYEHSTSLVVGGKALTHVAAFYRLLCIC